jgi:hypothetical protein
MEFKHPKYYKELRRRNKLDQAISKPEPTGHARVRPGPGLKQQASSTKHQATSKPEPSSGSEISSSKLQASSYKRQA